MTIVQIPDRDWQGCFAEVHGADPSTLSKWIVAERRGKTESSPISELSFDQDQGRLHLRLADGARETVAAGEVWVQKISGETKQILVIAPESHDAVLHLVLRPDRAVGSGRVSFKPLATHAAEELLARNNIGRIAFVRDGAPRIRPVHYVYRTRNLYGRTSPDSELGRTVSDGDEVAFEVDEALDLFNWQSVIVQGPILFLPPESASVQSERGRALGILRTLIEGTFGDTDPTPSRTHIFRIPAQSITGRVAATDD